MCVCYGKLSETNLKTSASFNQHKKTVIQRTNIEYELIPYVASNRPAHRISLFINSAFWRSAFWPLSHLLNSAFRLPCSIKYLTVPNNSHLRHCACAILESLVCRCLIYLIFISSVTVTVRFKVNCRVRVRFNNSHMSHKCHTASYLAMRHIWHDTSFWHLGVRHSGIRTAVRHSGLRHSGLHPN